METISFIEPVEEVGYYALLGTDHPPVGEHRGAAAQLHEAEVDRLGEVVHGDQSAREIGAVLSE